MGHKKQHHEEHVDEAWLLPYSDMLTLLLALFIVMFAMSKVDQKKFQQLSQEFKTIFKGGAGVLNDSGGAKVTVIEKDNTVTTKKAINPVDNKISIANARKTNSAIEQSQMAAIKENLMKEIKKQGYQNRIGVALNSEGLIISIQDNVIFRSGDAEILGKFNPELVQISNMIKKLNNDMRVSGHTDNVPIKSYKFNSNWDLSYQRAYNVMNFLVNIGHLKPQKFSIQAYGEYNNKFNNSTAAGRAKNRSVDILVVRNYQ